MDDISIITDVINKEDKGRIFMRLKSELENLDPVVKSIQVTDPKGQVKIECSVYRKKAVAYIYILPSSAHSKKLRLGVIRGEFLRYLTLCSTEEGYDEVCERLWKSLETRGYKQSEVHGEKDRILWNSKQEVLKKREQRGEISAKGKTGTPGILVVVPDIEGLREWCQQYTSRTESMGDSVKRNRKKK